MRRWFFADVPAERLAALRVVVFGFALVYLLGGAGLLLRCSSFSASSFRPVGPVTILGEPLPVVVVVTLWVLAVGGCATACLGVRWRISGPLAAALLLWVTSYRNSWSMTFHTENLLVLHAIVLAFTPAADAWSWDARRGGLLGARIPSFREAGLYGWGIQTVSVVTVLAYVVAGIAKLHVGGWEWATGEALRSQVAYDALRKIELGSIHSPLASPAVSMPWLFPPLAWLTFAFELGAPFALLGGRWSMLWCSIAWGFHVGVLALMAIVFPYPLAGCAFASFLPLERIARRGSLALGTRRDFIRGLRKTSIPRGS